MHPLAQLVLYPTYSGNTITAMLNEALSLAELLIVDLDRRKVRLINLSLIHI